MSNGGDSINLGSSAISEAFNRELQESRPVESEAGPGGGRPGRNVRARDDSLGSSERRPDTVDQFEQAWRQEPAASATNDAESQLSRVSFERDLESMMSKPEQFDRQMWDILGQEDEDRDTRRKHTANKRSELEQVLDECLGQVDGDDEDITRGVTAHLAAYLDEHDQEADPESAADDLGRELERTRQARPAARRKPSNSFLERTLHLMSQTGRGKQLEQGQAQRMTRSQSARPARDRRSSSFVERHFQWMTRKQQRIEETLQRRLAADMTECTFTPRLSTKSKSIVAFAAPTRQGNRLRFEAAQVEREEKEWQECTFKPQINEYSRVLVQRARQSFRPARRDQPEVTNVDDEWSFSPEITSTWKKFPTVQEYCKQKASERLARPAPFSKKKQAEEQQHGNDDERHVLYREQVHQFIQRQETSLALKHEKIRVWRDKTLLALQSTAPLTKTTEMLMRKVGLDFMARQQVILERKQATLRKLKAEVDESYAFTPKVAPRSARLAARSKYRIALSATPTRTPSPPRGHPRDLEHLRARRERSPKSPVKQDTDQAKRLHDADIEEFLRRQEEFEKAKAMRMQERRLKYRDTEEDDLMEYLRQKEKKARGPNTFLLRLMQAQAEMAEHRARVKDDSRRPVRRTTRTVMLVKANDNTPAVKIVNDDDAPGRPTSPSLSASPKARDLGTTANVLSKNTSTLHEQTNRAPRQSKPDASRRMHRNAPAADVQQQKQPGPKTLDQLLQEQKQQRQQLLGKQPTQKQQSPGHQRRQSQSHRQAHQERIEQQPPQQQPQAQRQPESSAPQSQPDRSSTLAPTGPADTTRPRGYSMFNAVRKTIAPGSLTQRPSGLTGNDAGGTDSSIVNFRLHLKALQSTGSKRSQLSPRSNPSGASRADRSDDSASSAFSAAWAEATEDQ